MRYEMTCPDCEGLGWYPGEPDIFDDVHAERCEACKGEGHIVVEPTPGPWRVIEVRPAREDGQAGLWFQAPEGHMGVYSAGADEQHLEIRSDVAHMDRLVGSGEGGLIARIPLAFGKDGRAQALMNAHALAAAHVGAE